MKLTLIASALAVAITATAAHAQYAAPAAAIKGVAPDATLTPTQRTVRYSLAPGASSKPIRPPADVQVWITGTQSDSGFRGVGQAVLLRDKNNLLMWTGLESPPNSAITQGYARGGAAHILWLDYGHTVDIEANTDDTFVIHNAGTSQADGRVNLLW